MSPVFSPSGNKYTSGIEAEVEDSSPICVGKISLTSKLSCWLLRAVLEVRIELANRVALDEVEGGRTVERVECEEMGGGVD